MLITYKDKKPKVGTATFIAENATIIGDVTIGKECGVFPGAVIRGDNNRIIIGDRTNIQDLCAIHTSDKSEALIGSDVTIGHGAIIHGHKIGDRCLIGMGAIIMEDVVIGEECIIAAGALLTEGTTVPPRTLMLGTPARPKRELTAEEIKKISESARHYTALANNLLFLPSKILINPSLKSFGKKLR